MSVRVNTKELISVLDKTPNWQNILLMGKHGIGKSQIIENYFKSKGKRVVILFLGQMSDPGDLIGLLHKNETTGKTEFMPPYWFPTNNEPVVLFLDELNRARPEVLQTIMDLVLNKSLAGKKLPEGSQIVSAVNNGDEYQLTDLDPALVSRFNIYEFCPTPTEWIVWATKQGLDPRVIDFISKNKEFLDGDGTKRDYVGLEKTPDRRAWERVCYVLDNVSFPTNEDKKIVGGIIGVAAAAKLFENFSENSILSAESLLCKEFNENTIRVLKNYKTPEYAVINLSIFRFLESEGDKLKDKNLAATNLEKYYDFLESNNYREALAHFANMFAGTDFPQAVCFFISETMELYERLTKYVNSLR